MTEASIAVALAINAFGILGLFWKVSRFITRFEVQHDMMWNDYNIRHDLAPRDRREHSRNTGRD